jgi:CPA1 family monovalent cation:H+ antiporter
MVPDVTQYYLDGSRWSDSTARLRGGISIALALSLPAGPERDLLVTVAYFVVTFSVLVLGLTFGRLIKRLLPAEVTGGPSSQPDLSWMVRLGARRL